MGKPQQTEGNRNRKSKKSKSPKPPNESSLEQASHHSSTIGCLRALYQQVRSMRANAEERERKEFLQKQKSAKAPRSPREAGVATAGGGKEASVPRRKSQVRLPSRSWDSEDCSERNQGNVQQPAGEAGVTPTSPPNREKVIARRASRVRRTVSKSGKFNTRQTAKFVLRACTPLEKLRKNVWWVLRAVQSIMRKQQYGGELLHLSNVRHALRYDVIHLLVHHTLGSGLSGAGTRKPKVNPIMQALALSKQAAITLRASTVAEDPEAKALKERVMNENVRMIELTEHHVRRMEEKFATSGDDLKQVTSTAKAIAQLRLEAHYLFEAIRKTTSLLTKTGVKERPSDVLNKASHMLKDARMLEARMQVLKQNLQHVVEEGRLLSSAWCPEGHEMDVHVDKKIVSCKQCMKLIAGLETCSSSHPTRPNGEESKDVRNCSWACSVCFPHCYLCKNCGLEQLALLDESFQDLHIDEDWKSAVEALQKAIGLIATAQGKVDSEDRLDDEDGGPTGSKPSPRIIPGTPKVEIEASLNVACAQSEDDGASTMAAAGSGPEHAEVAHQILVSNMSHQTEPGHLKWMFEQHFGREVSCSVIIDSVSGVRYGLGRVGGLTAGNARRAADFLSGMQVHDRPIWVSAFKDFSQARHPALDINSMSSAFAVGFTGLGVETSLTDLLTQCEERVGGVVCGTLVESLGAKGQDGRFHMGVVVFEDTVRALHAVGALHNAQFENAALDAVLLKFVPVDTAIAVPTGSLQLQDGKRGAIALEALRGTPTKGQTVASHDVNQDVNPPSLDVSAQPSWHYVCDGTKVNKKCLEVVLHAESPQGFLEVPRYTPGLRPQRGELFSASRPASRTGLATPHRKPFGLDVEGVRRRREEQRTTKKQNLMATARVDMAQETATKEHGKPRVRQQLDAARRAASAMEADRVARRLCESQGADTPRAAAPNNYFVAPALPLHGLGAFDLQVWRSTAAKWREDMASSEGQSPDTAPRRSLVPFELCDMLLEAKDLVPDVPCRDKQGVVHWASDPDSPEKGNKTGIAVRAGGSGNSGGGTCNFTEDRMQRRCGANSAPPGHAGAAWVALPDRGPSATVGVTHPMVPMPPTAKPVVWRPQKRAFASSTPHPANGTLEDAGGVADTRSPMVTWPRELPLNAPIVTTSPCGLRPMTGDHWSQDRIRQGLLTFRGRSAWSEADFASSMVADVLKSPAGERPDDAEARAPSQAKEMPAAYRSLESALVGRPSSVKAILKGLEKCLELPEMPQMLP